MGINPGSYEDYGRKLAEAAERAVQRLLGVGRKVIFRLTEDPGAELAARRFARNEAERAARDFAKDAEAWAVGDLADAYLEGLEHADREAAKLGSTAATGTAAARPLLVSGAPGTVAPLPPSAGAKFAKIPRHRTMYEAFLAAARREIDRMSLSILRAGDDIVREVSIEVGRTALHESVEGFTRRDLSQQLMDRFVKRGVASVTYRDGKVVGIDVYAEMLGRTMTGQASVQASLTRYQEHGWDLVVVSAHFRKCPLCEPWEGKVLSQSGRSERYPGLADAIAAGLWHPNCRHDVSPYLQGTEMPKPTMSAGEAALVRQHGLEEARDIVYRAEQRQRSIERRIRRWKLVEKYPANERHKSIATKRLRRAQADMREHLKEFEFLPRKYVREQIEKAR
jgi:hypothetical protein